MEQRLGIIRLSYEALRQALHLPDNAKIVAVSGELFFLKDEIAIKVECPDFAPVKGGEIPYVRPWLKRITHTHDEVVFDQWG